MTVILPCFHLGSSSGAWKRVLLLTIIGLLTVWGGGKCCERKTNENMKNKTKWLKCGHKVQHDVSYHGHVMVNLHGKLLYFVNSRLNFGKYICLSHYLTFRVCVNKRRQDWSLFSSSVSDVAVDQSWSCTIQSLLGSLFVSDQCN